MRSFKPRVENITDVMSLVTAGGNVLYATASAASVFGYCPEEIVEQNALDLFHPEDRDYTRRALSAVLAKPPGPRQVNVRIRRKDGAWLWWKARFSTS